MSEKIHKESRRIWEELGPWWDASIEDGDYFHRAFLFPTMERLLDLKGGERVLDAGCGNGAFSRRMAKIGAKVFGVDFSSTLIEQARRRGGDVVYEVMDLTDGEALKQLSQSQKFDKIVCSMVLHDMSTLLPFFAQLSALLKPNGSFLFTIPHPCFNAPSVLFEPPGGLTIKGYIAPEIIAMRSKPGQPIEQLVFHRPLREYFNCLIDQGMMMNGFEEPCVDSKLLPEGSLWGLRPMIPPALISRWVCR